MESYFSCQMDLPAYVDPNGGYHYPKLKIYAHAWKHSNSISIDVTDYEVQGLSQLGLLEIIIDHYEDSPEAFLNAIHDHAQGWIEKNWPLAEPEPGDFEDVEYEEVYAMPALQEIGRAFNLFINEPNPFHHAELELKKLPF